MSGRLAAGRARRLPSPFASCVWGYCGLFVAWQLWRWGAAAGQGLIVDGAFVLPGIVAVGLSWAASRRCGERRTASAWRWITISIVLLSATFAAQFAYQAIDGSVPFPSLADAFYLLFIPAYLIGLLRFPKSPESKEGLLRVWADVATVGLAGASVIWFLVLGPTVMSSGQSLFQGGVSGAYPTGDFLEIFVLVYVIRRVGDPSTQKALRMLAIGTVIAVVADVGDSWMVLHPQHNLLPAVNCAFMVAWGFFVLAGPSQRKVSILESPADATTSGSQWTGWASSLPYLAPMVVFGLLVYVQFNGSFVDRVSLTIGAALVSGLVLMRQFYARQLALKNVQLTAWSAELEGRVEERTAELAQAQIELDLARKLEAIGQLAAGVAHEINTPVQYVGATLHFLRESFDELMTLISVYGELVDGARRGAVSAELLTRVQEAERTADLGYLTERVPPAFERAVDGVDRVATIVAALRQFAHPSGKEMEPGVDLAELLRTTLTMTANEYKYVADLELELGELPPVVCNRGDLGQLFMNLIINAAHAIGDVVGDSGARGKLTITTAADAHDVKIQIADTGTGIPEEIADRVYDPFFTTKEVGRGTGQGLAIARTIVVDGHHGVIDFATNPAGGTTFTVTLPIGGPASDELARAA